MEVMENNAAVEIQRRKAIIEAQAREPLDKSHRANVPLSEKARAVAMHPSRMRLAEYERQDWIANAEPGHTVEDILKPGFWSHMAAQMTAYDHIEVRAEDGSWVAYLLVVQADRQWAKVVLLSKVDLVTADEMPSSTPMHKVEWKGPQRKFGVIRSSDSEMVRDGFQTKDEARLWMRDHEQTITAG